MQQAPHWRVAGAAAVFVLAGTSAVVLAVHDKPTGSVAYRSWPEKPPALRLMPSRRPGAVSAGIRLLSEAVSACRATAFSGVQVSSWQGLTGLRESLVNVWHRPGSQTVVQLVNASEKSQASGTASALPEPNVPVFLSEQQFSELEAGYVLDYQGPSTMGGRPAVVVNVRRPDGTLAASYWLDLQTKLPLRRQTFDTHAGLVSDIRFTDLRIGPSSLGGMPATGVSPWSQLSQSAVMSLRAQGWPLPVELPGGMVLSAASEMPSATGPAIGLSYSDGLSVISLFVQRGDLPPHLGDWQPIAIAGHSAYAVDRDDQTITWSGDGHVFTLITDAPTSTVEQAIGALPNSEPYGFWDRLARGFRRLASWANPFH